MPSGVAARPAPQAQLEAALVQWFRSQAPEALKGRLSQEDFAATIEVLSAPDTVRLIITLANFLHEEFVCGHPQYPGRTDSRCGGCGVGGCC